MTQTPNNSPTLTDATTLTNAILAALAPSKEELPMPVPLGDLGRCAACGYTVVSHLQAVGTTVRFIGCLKGTADTVFVLVPVTRAATRPASTSPSTTDESVAPSTRRKLGGMSKPVAAVAHERAPRVEEAMLPVEVEPTVPPSPRGFKRARYFSTVDRRRSLDKMDISPVRRKVLAAVHKAEDMGLLARQIRKRTGLTHGSVQQVLNWLRAHEVVTAREDGEATPHAIAS